VNRFRVSVDIGGTFTDLVALNEDNGNLVNIKVSSTPRKPAEGVIEAFKIFLKEVKPEEVTSITHATTIAVNALLGQLGLELPKVALITTRGFKDVIEIGRQRRHELYNLFIQKPKMLIPRNLRYEIDERIGPSGEVWKPLNVDGIRSLLIELKREEVKAIAIGLLPSYINPKHEKEVEEIFKHAYPEVLLSPSYKVAPEHREYERISTTVVNACLMPIVSIYMNDLFCKFRNMNISAPICIMQSSGGVASKNLIIKKPVSMIESGPAAGVMASSFYGNMLGIENIISFDMGGTTAKAGVVRGGVPGVVTEYEVAGKVHSGRIVKGSGYPVKFPFVDLAECSAGGGTIAWIDAGGAIKVGPVSAGADPGPACYGMGGENPTVTDANLVLGRLNPQYLLGGRMRLFSDLSEKSINKKICEKTGLKLIDGATGIIKIVNSTMAKILKIVSVERGYDPRQFTLNAFGGAGPMHACALAEELKMSKIVVPINPGLFSALGLLAADFSHTITEALMMKAGDINPIEIEEKFEKLRAEGIKILEFQKVKPNYITIQSQLDMRYVGQGYELTVQTSAPFKEEEFNKVKRKFHTKHKAIYGYAVEDWPVEFVNARVIAIGVVTKPKLIKQEISEKEPHKDAFLSRRNIYFERYNDYVKSPVYTRQKLKPGNFVFGPAVIEQYDATTIVYPDWTVVVDEYGNLVMNLEGEPSNGN
jgi:N-methylhydantoinase A